MDEEDESGRGINHSIVERPQQGVHAQRLVNILPHRNIHCILPLRLQRPLPLLPHLFFDLAPPLLPRADGAERHSTRTNCTCWPEITMWGVEISRMSQKMYTSLTLPNYINDLINNCIKKKNTFAIQGDKLILSQIQISLIVGWILVELEIHSLNLLVKKVR